MPTKQNTNQRKNMHKMVCSSAFGNKQGVAQARCCTPLLPAGRGDRQVDPDEFQASLVCISSTRPARLNETMSQKRGDANKIEEIVLLATTGWTSRHQTQKLKQIRRRQVLLERCFQKGPKLLRPREKEVKEVKV